MADSDNKIVPVERCEDVPPSAEVPPAQAAESDKIAPVERYALVPTNPAVVALSTAFRWRPETAIARIQRALPDTFEQQVYLALAESSRIYPESLAKLLAMYRGSRPLSVLDLERRPIGKNAISNSFGDFSDFFEACMHLIKVVSKEYAAFNLSMELAAEITLAYGTNQPEQVVEMIDINLDECCAFFDISEKHSYSVRMRLCTYLFIKQVLPELRDRGVPNPLDPDEFIHGKFRGLATRSDDVDAPEVQQKIHDLLYGGGIL